MTCDLSGNNREATPAKFVKSIKAIGRNLTMSLTNTPAESLNEAGIPRPIVTEIALDERERMLASQSFRFRHQLGGHPIMNLPKIRNLVEQMLAEGRFDQIFYKTGKSMETGQYGSSEPRVSGCA